MRMLNNDEVNLLYQLASNSVRLRSHFLLHHTHDDKVQRLLIAMVRGSYVEPHYHGLEHQWEMFSVIHGEIKVCLYDQDGNVLKGFFVNSEDALPLVEFSPNEIHSVECISERVLMLEVKEGPFDSSMPKIFPAF